MQKHYLTLIFFLFIGDNLAQSVKVATVDQIKAFCGTNKVKMIVDQKGTGLFYIDYSEVDTGIPPLHAIPSTAAAILPVISPDGNWIAYSTGVTNEFDAGPSTSWMRSLSDLAANPIKISDTAYVPRFVKNSMQPAVVYSTCSFNPDTSKTAYEGCGVVKAAQWNNYTWTDTTLWPHGSYLGGLSYDNRYLADGGQKLHCFMLDLQNAANGPIQLHNIPAKTKTGKDTIVTSEVCNTSISSSKIFTNSMMYLDFGFDSTIIQVHSLLGSWDFHKRLFISDYSGSIIKYFDLPNVVNLSEATEQSRGNADHMEWNYPEWSNHPYFAAVALNIERVWYENGTTLPWKYKSKNEKTCILNVKTGAVLLDWPFLWVDAPPSFSETSGWLAIQNQTRSRSVVKERISLAGNIVTSSVPMSEVELYSVTGKLVWRKNVLGKKTLHIQKALSSAIWLLRIKTSDNGWIAGKVQLCN
jgi:hypothetical protein